MRRFRPTNHETELAKEALLVREETMNADNTTSVSEVRQLDSSAAGLARPLVIAGAVGVGLSFAISLLLEGVNKILARSTGLKIQVCPCGEFSREHHDLYLQVWGRSDAKLEKLTLGFFKGLPSEFRMITAHHGEDLAGWAIILETTDGLDFFLGGIQYRRNHEQAVYLRLLLEIVRIGIETEASSIDLGQTAEIPKMRLGAICHTLHMGATHSNPVFRFLLQRVAGLLEYRRQVSGHHVFGVQP